MTTKQQLLDIETELMRDETSDNQAKRILELAAYRFRVTVAQIEWLLSDAVANFSNDYIENTLKSFQSGEKE